MRSRSSEFCDAARPGGPVGAFSLLELLIVLAVVALVAGLVAPSLGAGAAARREQRQCAELVTLLAAQRVGAMRAGRGFTVELHWSDDRLSASRMEDPARVWTGWRTSMTGADGRALTEAFVPFDPVGRCPVPELCFRARDGSDRIWTVVFDPISGAPSLRQGSEQR